jgi:hypothetical protein
VDVDHYKLPIFELKGEEEEEEVSRRFDSINYPGNSRRRPRCPVNP